MFRFTTFMALALALALLVADEGFAQRRGRSRGWTQQAVPQYYSAPVVQPVVQRTTVVSQAPPAVPCDEPVQIVPTQGAPVPGDAPSPNDAPPPEAPPAGAPEQSGKPWYRCEDCKNPDCKGEGKCELYNPPKILKSGGPECEEKHCEPRDNPAKGHLPELDGHKQPFYKKCVKFKARIDVPHLVKDSREYLEFGKQKYSVYCCAYEVCVVTCCCCVDAKYCKLAPYDANLEACIRYDGKVDIYVVGVPGMPERWVLGLGLGADAAKADYPAIPADLFTP